MPLSSESNYERLDREMRELLDRQCDSLEFDSDPTLREACEAKIVQIIQSGKKVRIFVDFLAMIFPEVALYRKIHQEPCCSWLIEKIVNPTFVKYLACLFQKFGERNFALEVLFDKTDPRMAEIDRPATFSVGTSGRPVTFDSKFLLSLFFETLKFYYPSLQMTADNVVTHILQDSLCYVICLANVSNSSDKRFFYSPLVPWSSDNQAEAYMTWQLLVKSVADSEYSRRYFPFDFYITPLSPGRYLRYLVAEAIAINDEYTYNFYFRSLKPNGTSLKDNLPVFEVAVGWQRPGSEVQRSFSFLRSVEQSCAYAYRGLAESFTLEDGRRGFSTDRMLLGNGVSPSSQFNPAELLDKPVPSLQIVASDSESDSGDVLQRSGSGYRSEDVERGWTALSQAHFLAYPNEAVNVSSIPVVTTATAPRDKVSDWLCGTVAQPVNRGYHALAEIQKKDSRLTLKR